MRLRILTDLFRQNRVSKTLKYTKYSCGFTPFSDEKSLARLSCRFVRYCPIIDLPNSELENTNFVVDKPTPLCYNDLAFGQIFFVHWLVIAN